VIKITQKSTKVGFILGPLSTEEGKSRKLAMVFLLTFFPSLQTLGSSVVGL